MSKQMLNSFYCLHAKCHSHKHRRCTQINSIVQMQTIITTTQIYPLIYVYTYIDSDSDSDGQLQSNRSGTAIILSFFANFQR